jgi:hypothetical protein
VEELSRHAAIALSLIVATIGCTPPANTSPVDPARASACARILSCPVAAFPNHDSLSVSQCLFRDPTLVGANPEGTVLITTSLFGTSWTTIACVNAAADCTGVIACVSGSEPLYCGSHPDGSTACQGDTLIMCDGGQPKAADCAVHGDRCLVGSDGQARCGRELCSSPAPQHCEGSVLSACADGILTTVDCTIAATGCFDGSSSAACGDATATCSQMAGVCDGDDLVQCTDGIQSRLHCGRMRVPQTCGSYTTQVGSVMTTQTGCMPRSSLACNPATHHDRCDGAQLIYCDGSEQILDCRSLGFSNCGTRNAAAVCL